MYIFKIDRKGHFIDTVKNKNKFTTYIILSI